MVGASRSTYIILGWMHMVCVHSYLSFNIFDKQPKQMIFTENLTKINSRFISMANFLSDNIWQYCAAHVVASGSSYQVADSHFLTIQCHGVKVSLH